MVCGKLNQAKAIKSQNSSTMAPYALSGHACATHLISQSMGYRLPKLAII